MKCTHVCAAQKAYQLFTKLLIKPDFPSLADEIAKTRPDMNIKAAAFTVSEKSSNIYVLFLLCFRARVCLLLPCGHLLGKGLTSWLSFVMSNCEVSTFPCVSWVWCGA